MAKKPNQDTHQKKYTILICDDSKAERMNFYERQFENFNIYGVKKIDGKFIEVDSIDSVDKLHQLLVKQRDNDELPDLVLLDLFYKRNLPNIDDLEKNFVEKLLLMKKDFNTLRHEVNQYLIPAGVELLKRLRGVDGISPQDLPICVYTDKNFNFLVGDDFNVVYELAPMSMSKDRDFEEPKSMIPTSTEYFRLLSIIEESRRSRGIIDGNRVFISHGRSNDWKLVQEYIEKRLNISTLELSQEPNLGRSIIKKLDDSAAECGYAVIVMTGDDPTPSGARVRENVMHEIGFFQGRLGLERVCLVYEDGTTIPSNLSGIVRLPYDTGNVASIFGILGQELARAGLSS